MDASQIKDLGEWAEDDSSGRCARAGDFLVSLEDGKRYKSLKRHLGVRGLTPDEYRAKWKLPADYPMVAPNYAAARSPLAKSSGLGRKPAPKAKRRVNRKG